MANLGSLLREPLRNGHSAKRSADGTGVRTLTLSAVTYGDFSEKNSKLTSADPAKVADLWLEPGDLLVERSNTPDLVGTSRLYRGPSRWAIFPDLMIRVRLSDAVLADYAELFLMSEPARRYFQENAQGTAGSMPKIDQGIIEELPVPLAPPAEQRRIVDKVESLLEQINRAKARLDRIPLILKRFRQSILAAACSGALTGRWRDMQSTLAPVEIAPLRTDDAPDAEVPRSWRWVATESLCDPSRAITYGVIKLGEPVADGVPTLRSSDVRWLRIDETSVKRISPSIADQYVRTFLRGGEVLVTVRGTLGGVASVPSRMAGYNISREVAVLPISAAVNADFIALAVANMAAQNWLRDRAKGAAYTGINIEDLRQLPLPIPPRAEQDEVVRTVRALSSIANEIDRRVDSATERCASLPAEVLSKAFRGDLVASDAELAHLTSSDFEPASALLARLGAMPNARTATPRRKTVGAGHASRQR